MSLSVAKLAIAPVLAAAVAAVGASSAAASITVDDNTPTDGQTLTATVSSPPSGATQYTLAECNVTDATPANWGRDCNQASGLSFAPVSTTSRQVTVNSSFTNHSFVPGQSPLQGASTTCKALSGGSQCAVVVSWYSALMTPVGTAQKANITF